MALLLSDSMAFGASHEGNVPPRAAPWVHTNSSNQCGICSTNFGVFTWKHHCRYCGALVCDSCSNFRSKEVIGYEGVSVRVCKRCFFNEISLLVVWHSRFSYKAHVVESVEVAQKLYNGIRDTCSRAIVRMRDGQILQCWFKNEEWKTKILNRATSERAERQRVHPGAGSLGSSVLSTANNTNMNQRAAPLVPSDPKRMPPLGPYGNVFLAYRCDVNSPYRFLWQEVSDVKDMPTILEKVKLVLKKRRAVQGAMIAPDGLCHFVHNDVEQFPNTQVASEVEGMMKVLPVMITWHLDGFYRSHYVRQYQELPAALTYADPTAPTVVCDMTGRLLYSRNCVGQSWKDALSRACGAAILKEHQFNCVAVAVDPSRIEFFTDICSAYKACMETTGAGMFAIPPNSVPEVPVPAFVIQAEEDFDFDIAEVKLCACVGAAILEQSSRIKKARESQESVVPACTPPAPAKELDCPICMDHFNVEERRPCICGQCGNTACHACMAQMQNCASCRHPLPVGGRFPPNVAIMRLLDSTDRSE